MGKCWRRFKRRVGRWPACCPYLVAGVCLVGILVWVVPACGLSASAVSTIMGATISVWLVLLIELVRQPNLVIVTDTYRTDSGEVVLRALEGGKLKETGRVCVHQVRIVNKPIQLTLGLLRREIARDCRGDVVFRHPADGTRVVFEMPDGRPNDDSPMIGRWAHSPQPTTYSQVAGEVGESKWQQEVDYSKLVIYWDIPSHDETRGILGVAFRHKDKGEAACYGLCNDVYYFDWKPTHWKLEPGTYLVDVVVTASNAQAEGVFVLRNEGTQPEDFTLEEACDNQVEIVRQKRTEERKAARQEQKWASREARARQQKCPLV